MILVNALSFYKKIFILSKNFYYDKISLKITFDKSAETLPYDLWVEYEEPTRVIQHVKTRKQYVILAKT